MTTAANNAQIVPRISAYFNAFDVARRTDVAANEINQPLSAVVADMYDYFLSQPGYLARSPRFRAMAKLKAEEWLSSDILSSKAKYELQKFLDLIETDDFKARPEYVASGGRRRQRTRKGSRKTLRKSRGRRRGSK